MVRLVAVVAFVVMVLAQGALAQGALAEGALCQGALAKGDGPLAGAIAADGRAAEALRAALRPLDEAG